MRAGPHRSRQTRLAALSGTPAAAGALSSSSRLVAARRGIPAVPLCPVVSSRVWMRLMTTSNRLRMAMRPLGHAPEIVAVHGDQDAVGQVDALDEGDQFAVLRAAVG